MGCDRVFLDRGSQRFQVTVEFLQRNAEIRGANLPLLDGLRHRLGYTWNLAHLIGHRLPIDRHTCSRILGCFAHLVQCRLYVFWKRRQARHQPVSASRPQVTQIAFEAVSNSARCFVQLALSLIDFGLELSQGNGLGRSVQLVEALNELVQRIGEVAEFFLQRGRVVPHRQERDSRSYGECSDACRAAQHCHDATRCGLQAGLGCCKLGGRGALGQTRFSQLDRHLRLHSCTARCDGFFLCPHHSRLRGNLVGLGYLYSAGGFGDVGSPRLQ
ncbi:Uncharacterised protein [Pseudomonas putida]|nr:Uncharacterised protein [Pseudomonas putida]CAB5628897.1 Uncharacterised protein [Pseudomonas putida]CAB5629377.1 Uncharacterised protein [Pseudomonas putida]CAB5706171.1 Uncharacterised protein [Pseudomonas putida]CAB5719669.1 Uncharacterised protein [Pseudomonas putida]